MAAKAEAEDNSEAVDDADGAVKPGTILAGKYRVLGLLGQGGMGEVYEAEHVRLGRCFAIKLLKSRCDRHAIERFDREVRAISRLESDYVVIVVDAGKLEDGAPYFVMERLRGSDLRTLLKSFGPLPLPRAVACIQQACFGISAAHGANVIHRDLKPENLFVVQRQHGPEICKVLDFGVAKLQTSDFTQQGAVIGTIKYMAPEQLTDSADVGAFTDVYALGAILFECLTGRAPHGAATVHEMMFKIMNTDPGSVRSERPDVPAELDAIIRRALAREPAARFQSAEAFARALEPFTRTLPAERSGTVDASSNDTRDIWTQSNAPPVGGRSHVRSKRALGAVWLGVGLLLGFSFSRLAANIGESSRLEPRASLKPPTPVVSVPEAPRAEMTNTAPLPTPKAQASIEAPVEPRKPRTLKRSATPADATKLTAEPAPVVSAPPTSASSKPIGRAFVRKNPYAPEDSRAP